MKALLKNTVIVLAATLGSTGLFAQNYENENRDEVDGAYEEGYDEGFKKGEEITYQKFYDDLSPHGRWINVPEHGYVWAPRVDADFRPYSTNGRWVYANNYDWMWVSNYAWGWAPFHYGRWYHDAGYGWLWVPGYEWSPAWVAWRQGGDYYGWAPLRPGISINIRFNIGGYNPPSDYWCFTPRRYINSRRINRHFINPTRNITIINQTTIINNYNYNRNVYRTGPRRSEAEVYTGRITPVRFRPSGTAGRAVVRNNEVNVYRPSIRNNTGVNAAPRSFERTDRTTNNSNANGREPAVRNENANSSRTGKLKNRPRTDNRLPENDSRIIDRKERIENSNRSGDNNNPRRIERTRERPQREDRNMQVRTERSPRARVPARENTAPKRERPAIEPRRRESSTSGNSRSERSGNKRF